MSVEDWNKRNDSEDKMESTKERSRRQTQIQANEQMKTASTRNASRNTNGTPASRNTPVLLPGLRLGQIERLLEGLVVIFLNPPIPAAPLLRSSRGRSHSAPGSVPGSVSGAWRRLQTLRRGWLALGPPLRVQLQVPEEQGPRAQVPEAAVAPAGRQVGLVGDHLEAPEGAGEHLCGSRRATHTQARR